MVLYFCHDNCCNVFISLDLSSIVYNYIFYFSFLEVIIPEIQALACLSWISLCKMWGWWLQKFDAIVSRRCAIVNKICRGRGTSFFPVKHEKLPPSYFQDAKNFSVVKPLNSGEARASPASPIPRPLYILYIYIYILLVGRIVKWKMLRK